MATNMVGPQLDNKVRRFDEFFQHVFTFRLQFFSRWALLLFWPKSSKKAQKGQFLT